MKSSLLKLAVAAALVGLTSTAALAGGDKNPYDPKTDHPWRHGAMATRETTAHMKAWEHAHSANFAAPTASTGKLSYGGGTGGVGVGSGQVKVYLVFYGTQWGTQSGTDPVSTSGYYAFSGDSAGAAGAVQKMFKGIGTNSELWQADLTQWCEGIASGSSDCSAAAASSFVPYQQNILAGVWYDNTQASPASATAAQLGNEATAAAAHFGNTTSASNRYAYYVILSPHGTNPDNYQSPTQGYCAWHDYSGDAGSTTTYGQLAFSNQPYNIDVGTSCGTNFVNSGSAGTLDGYTMTLGHEWHETMSDFFPAGGWTNHTGDATYNGQENSDECAWIAAGTTGGAANIAFSTGTFAEQASWSNDTGACSISHPIVSHGSGGDTTPPTVSASESGTSGTITLSATASDNVGVTKVEFYVDNVLKGTDTTSPYSMTLDSTTLSNASHSLTAKAYDAANNVGTSSAVSFTINNGTTSNVLQNGVGVTISDSVVNHQQNWTMAVPAGATNLVFSMSGGTGDPDLYVKFGSAPTLTSYDCRPYVSGPAESCPITTAQAGTYYVMVNTYAAYSGTTLKGSFTAPGGGDTTPPTVSASESGTSGTITLSATASDNVGVTKVEFYVDGTLKGTDTTSPYSMTLDSTTLSNASHSLVAKAYDAANNVGTSSTVTFTISNSSGGCTPTQLIVNGGFESGAATPWTMSAGVLDSSTGEPAHSGSWKAWMDGYGSAHTDTISQAVTVPACATSGTLQFYLHIDTAETGSTAYDKLTVTVGSTTVATFSNVNAAAGYVVHSYNVPVTGGSSVTVKFNGVEDASLQTSFVVDDVTFTAQ
jgi:serine protease